MLDPHTHHNRVLLFSVCLALSSCLVLSAPAVCRSCTKNCFQNVSNTTIPSGNGTSAEVGDLLAELQSHRPKRSSHDEVELKPCSRFQFEMLVIPLFIAMIPIGLSALILCTCYCGPKDSRVKLPEDFLTNLPMSKKKRMSSEELELEFRDGYVQRKDSSRTKFSTVVSYIEARRESLWSVRTDPDASTSAAAAVPPTRPADDVAEPPATPEVAAAVPDRLKKVASSESLKRTRFSDTVSVISLDSLSRR